MHVSSSSYDMHVSSSSYDMHVSSSSYDMHVSSSSGGLCYRWECLEPVTCKESTIIGSAANQGAGKDKVSFGFFAVKFEEGITDVAVCQLYTHPPGHPLAGQTFGFVDRYVSSSSCFCGDTVCGGSSPSVLSTHHLVLPKIRKSRRYRYLKIRAARHPSGGLSRWALWGPGCHMRRRMHACPGFYSLPQHPPVLGKEGLGHFEDSHVSSSFTDRSLALLTARQWTPKSVRAC